MGSVESFKSYDPTELIDEYKGPKPSILIDCGTEDKYIFPQDTLMLNNFEEAARKANYPVNIRWQKGYDHSFHMISTFMDDHIDHHCKALGLV